MNPLKRHDTFADVLTAAHEISLCRTRDREIALKSRGGKPVKVGRPAFAAIVKLVPITD